MLRKFESRNIKAKDIENIANDCLVELLDNNFQYSINHYTLGNTEYYNISIYKQNSPRQFFRWEAIADGVINLLIILQESYYISDTMFDFFNSHTDNIYTKKLSYKDIIKDPSFKDLMASVTIFMTTRKSASSYIKSYLGFK